MGLISKEKKEKIVQKLKNKYQLTIYNKDSLEQALSFSLTRLNVFAYMSVFAFIVAIIVGLLLIYTPLNLLLPSQQNSKLSRQLVNHVYKLDSLQTPLYKKELQSYYQKEQEIKSKKYQAKREYQRAKKSLKAGLVSQSDLEKSAYEFAQTKTALQSLRENQNVTWQSRQVQLQEQIENLEGEIKRLKEEMNGYTITAPISGTLIKYSGIKQHSFINGNQTIATISPDDNLIVECMVSPSDIGFITPNQQVNLQVDAFN